jgi:ATP-dependent protease ClpP protease subunit
MKRTAKAGLFPASLMREGTMRHDARAVFNRVPPAQGNWYSIQNKKDDTAVVYIYDEIGFWGVEASQFVKEIADIDAKNIHLHINSPGGEVFDGVAIYNALKVHPAHVKVVVDALAASSASFITQAGDEVVMTRNATMMIHDAMALAIGNEDDMLEAAALLSRISDNIADIYAVNAGGTVEDWRAQMKEEVWFTASEAVEAGLATEMLDATDEEAEEATNKWDLSIFNYAGRDKAPSPVEVRSEITNRVKEASMGKAAPKNQEETTTPPADPPVEPVEPGTDPAVEEPEDEEPTPEGQLEPALVPAAPAPEPTAQAPRMVAGVTFNMNGGQVTDLNAVQNHIDGLELFRKETLENGRKSFIAQLATDRKIAAPQITDLEEFALGLTDEQYEKWTATWNVAAPLAALGSHASGVSNPSGDDSPEDAQAAELQKYKDIVRQHKLGGMSPEAIQKTDSYIRLKELDPEYKL